MDRHTFYETAHAEEFLKAASDQVILDVRSPSEFAHAHIPGAMNLPLFDDDQRAEVGTIYKNSGHDSAVLRGLKFAGEKMTDLVAQARKLSGGDKKVLVHCWRGGMRSQSVGWLLSTAGLEPTLLEGGYKAFRQHARSFFSRPWDLRIVSGLTGAGKTKILLALKDAGQQILDLEGLANHRGSAFGGIGQAVQPSTEQFENELFTELQATNSGASIWVEDEGNRVGSVVVPPDFYDRMRHSPAVFMSSSPEQRVENLLVDYGDLPKQELADSIDKVRKRLGPQHADEAIEALERDDVAKAIEIVLAYYDKTYLKAAAAMPREEMVELSIDGLSETEVVRQMVAIADEFAIEASSKP